MTTDTEELARLANCLDGYAKSFDRLHRDIADDFRKSANHLRAYAALQQPDKRTEIAMLRVLSWLGHWRDQIPAEAVTQLQDIARTALQGDGH